MLGPFRCRRQREKNRMIDTAAETRFESHNVLMGGVKLTFIHEYPRLFVLFPQSQNNNTLCCLNNLPQRR